MKLLEILHLRKHQTQTAGEPPRRMMTPTCTSHEESCPKAAEKPVQDTDQPRQPDAGCGTSRGQHPDLRPVLAAILRTPDDVLRRSAYYAVQPSAARATGETGTKICCQGGCDMDVYTFSSERDALLFSALLKALGYQPPHNVACPSCYREYREDCI